MGPTTLLLCAGPVICTLSSTDHGGLESENAIPCKWCIYKQMLSLNRKKIKFIILVKYTLLEHYNFIVTFRCLIVTHKNLKKPSCA